MSKKPTRAPKGLKGGTLKKDDGEKIKWTGHLDTEATPSISDEELARAKTIFFQNDKDENGSIDRSELQWMLKELGQNPTDEMLDQMMVRPQFGAIRRNSSSRRLRSPGHPPAQKQADGGAVAGDALKREQKAGDAIDGAEAAKRFGAVETCVERWGQQVTGGAGA